MSDVPFLGSLALELIKSLPPLILAFALCVLMESLWPRSHLRLADRLPGFWFILAMPVFGAVIGPWLYAAIHVAGVGPIFDVRTLSPILTVALVIVVIDFLSYWEHRFEHRFWWRVHSVHHAARDMHAAMNYGHPIQYLGEFLWIGIPVIALGLGSIEIPLAVTVYRSFHTMLNHASTPMHLGFLRCVFVDNRYHRIHHSSDPRHFGRNFGTIFTIWDQLFDTAYFPEPDEWPDTGVDGLTSPRSLGQYLTQPFVRRDVA